MQLVLLLVFTSTAGVNDASIQRQRPPLVLAKKEEIKRNFGVEIANLVDGVTKLSKITFQQPTKNKQVENLRKFILAISEDIRVLFVKLADRLHNMRTLQYISNPDKRRRIARETLDIYAPLAERIGMEEMKDELEDLTFAELQPEARGSIVRRLDSLRNADTMIIPTVTNELSETCLLYTSDAADE